MKSKLKFLKHSVILIKVLFLWYTVSSQVYTFGDISSAKINYSVASLVEGKSNDIIILGKVTDNNSKNLQLGYSRITTNGQVLADIVFTDKVSLIDLNSILYQPDGMLRVYGTLYLLNGMTAPYKSLINTSNNTITNNINLVSNAEYFGEAKRINKGEIILTKSIKDPSSGLFNIHAYKINMALNDFEKNNVKLVSKFNEEPKVLYVLPDTSFIVLGRRDIDQNKSKSFGMIYCLSSDFKIKWNLQVLNSVGLSNQNLTCGKDGWIYHFSSKRDNGTCSSKGIIFDKDGNKLRQIETDSFFVNAILTLKNGNILVAGYKIQKYGQNKIEKAQYIVYDRTLKTIKSRMLGLLDKPDSELPATVLSALPISSEYTSAIQLANGKIVLGGKADLPVTTASDKVLYSARANKYLIAILTADGNL